MSRPSSEAWRKAGWSALVFVMALAFLEILARRTGTVEERAYIQMDFDAELMWGLQDAASGVDPTINRFGLRGPEPAEGIRLLTLGDSSVYGHGVAVDAVFGGVFAARLNAAALAAGRSGPRVVPVIGGVPGYSSFQARRLLARVGAAIRPDVVVIGTMWSDAYRSALPDREWSEQLAAAYGPWRPVTVPLAAVSRHSALARRLRAFIHDGWFPDHGGANEVGWSHLVPPEVRVGVATGTSPADEAAARERLQTTRVPLDAYAENLHGLAADARALGALPAFLLLPHPMDGNGPLPWLTQAYRDTLRRVAAEEHAPLVDAAAWYVAHPAEGRFADDIHPSVAGHAAIADAMEETFAADPAMADLLGIDAAIGR